MTLKISSRCFDGGRPPLGEPERGARLPHLQLTLQQHRQLQTGSQSHVLSYFLLPLTIQVHVQFSI